MNNCCGRDEDMQQRLVNIFPETGDKFQALICVPDTDDGSQIEAYINQWISEHLLFVDHYSINDDETPDSMSKGVFVDVDGNEAEVFSPSDSFSMAEYVIRQQRPIERNFSMTLRRLGYGNFEVDLLEHETGEHTTIKGAFDALGSHDDFDADIGTEICSWISLMEDETNDE